jgi:OCT family organic cation transporter-like MFS transporter 4/5
MLCSGDSFAIFCFLRFLLGAMSGGSGAVSFMLQTELVRSEDRGFIAVVVNLWCVFGFVWLAAWSYMLQDQTWQAQIFWCEVMPAVVTVPLMHLFVLESPRWAVTAQGPEAAMVLLNALAKVNGVALPPGAKLSDAAANVNIKPSSSSDDSGGGSSSGSAGSAGAPLSTMQKLRILFKPPLLLPLVVLFYTWLAVTFVYYGLSFQAGALGGGNIYLNSILLALAEVPAYLATSCLVDRKAWGRRYTQVLAFSVAGVALMIIAVPGLPSWGSTLMAMLGKSGAAAAFVVVYIFAGEVFPTVVRGSGLGLCNIGARIGGIAAPLMMNLSMTAALVIFGIFSIVAAFATLALAETLGKELQDTCSASTEESSDETRLGMIQMAEDC